MILKLKQLQPTGYSLNVARIKGKNWFLEDFVICFSPREQRIDKNQIQ